jgi:hypothetical protein
LCSSSLDFSDGLRFQDWISNKFNRPINLIPGKFDRHEFFLVVSFGRCSMRLCSESMGLPLQSFVGGEACFFRVSQLADLVFRFLISCKIVGFAVYRLRSYSCSVFKAYLHLWNSGGPNWFIEWQRYSMEESKSWKLVSHRRSSPAPFANMARKPALSGANLVPLGRQMRSVRASTGLKQRQSVFDQISFPLRTVSDHGAVVRPHFQNYSNRRIGRKVRSGFRSSLGGPALPHGPHVCGFGGPRRFWNSAWRILGRILSPALMALLSQRRRDTSILGIFPSQEIIHNYLVSRGRSAIDRLALFPICSRMPPGCFPRAYGLGHRCCRLQVGPLPALF